jgi:hypothetical protein
MKTTYIYIVWERQLDSATYTWPIGYYSSFKKAARRLNNVIDLPSFANSKVWIEQIEVN